MRGLSFLGKKLQQLSCFLCICTSNFGFLVSSLLRRVLAHLLPLLFQLCYFLLVSSLGFCVLKSLNPRTDHPTALRPRDLDLFFTSVSATTVSSMSTVEMEVFSDTQLLVLTLLMFLGGEVFTSMVELHFRASKFKKQWKTRNKADPTNSISTSNSSTPNHHRIELCSLTIAAGVDSGCNNSKPDSDVNDPCEQLDRLTCRSIKYLSLVALGYLIVMHVLGISSVLLYLCAVASAKRVLERKGLKALTFSIFATVSTFTNCGFIPTNENMVVFAKNSGLLLLLIPQVLMGNSLFAPCLRFSVWFLRKFTNSDHIRGCSDFLLEKTREVGSHHWLPGRVSRFLVATVFVFILAQVAAFCAMDWDSEGLNGLSVYQKLVGVLFECVNSRHSGESIVDISILSPAILVLFVLMMYLPPYTCFRPREGKEEFPRMYELEDEKRKKGKVVDSMIFSQLSCLVIFVILICITERKKMKEDPINFSTLNIVFETVSAYGNVGFTTGYSCDRRLKLDGFCENKWYGLAGRWSGGGKIILTAVMLFGRLRKFNMNGSKAWILQ